MRVHMVPALCLVMVSFVLQLGDYFYNSIGVLQQADVEQATQNGKLAFPHLKHIMKRSYVAFFLLFRLKTSSSYIHRWVNSIVYVCVGRYFPHLPKFGI